MNSPFAFCHFSRRFGRTYQAGFTMVELLVVISILMLLAGGLAQSLDSLGRQNRVRPAVMAFAAVLREARETAVREGTFVRVAFMTPEDRVAAATTASRQLRSGYGVYIYRVPGREVSGSVTLQPTREIESDEGLKEVAPTIRVPLARSLVGGWVAAEGHEAWKVWTEDLAVGGPVVESYRKRGFDAAQQEYLWQPEEWWAATTGEGGDATSGSPYAEHPRSFSRLPAVVPAKLVSRVLPATETVEVPGLGKVSAQTVWGEAPVMQWENPAAQDGGLEVPALDFQPDGGLAVEAAGGVEFHFSAAGGRAPHYRVIVRAEDGEVWIE